MDPAAQNINFRVAMPDSWNGKLLQFGGAGTNGEVPSPLGLGVGPGGRDSSVLTTAPPPLARGYVTFGSDSGHAGGLLEFALNEEQLRNFAGEQLKKTRDAVVQLAKRRYAAAPAHTYFLGGGTGGREAFAVIQDYPEDYDGVVATYPDIGTTATLLKMQTIARDMALNHAAGWISQAKADLLRRTELAACDALDGLQDSVISHVDACRVDFEKLRCKGGQDSGPECLSDAQLKTVRTMHSPTPLPYSLSNGRSSLPAYTIGAEWSSPHIAGKSWDAPASFDGIAYFALIDSFVRHVVWRDAKAADTLTFDPLNPGEARARIERVSQLLDRNNVDVDRFIARGGKWILIHGQAEQIFSAAVSIDYYRKLLDKYGRERTDGFLRFYLLPGHGHFNALGGPNLEALEDWVERGISPGTLTVVPEDPPANGRSRPMCVYPGWPKYNGRGDPQLASSFNCVRGP